MNGTNNVKKEKSVQCDWGLSDMNLYGDGMLPGIAIDSSIENVFSAPSMPLINGGIVYSPRRLPQRIHPHEAHSAQ